jgi:DNA-binding MarR family transcriptional regulator
MLRAPNSKPGRGASPAEASGRAALIARLVDLQPQFQHRFETTMPTHLSELNASLHDAMANTTMRQLEVLRLVATHGPLAMHELARLHGITRSSTTEVVDRLVGHGLVERRHDPLDRRSVEVALTARAEALLAQVRRLHDASIAVLTDAYDDEELATLVHLLERLAVAEPALAAEGKHVCGTAARGAARRAGQ